MREQTAVTLDALPGQATAAAPPVAALPPGSLLTLHGIWRYWGRRGKRWPVLRDVSLEMKPGSTTCLTGRNGAGKTTLLRIASGIVMADAGTVSMGELVGLGSWREFHRHIGFVSAGDRGLYARVSTQGHLDYWARLAFVPRAERRRAIHATLDHFGLCELAQRRADRLSQGQRQRLRIALAFVHRPNVLLLDEPLNSLDREGSEMLSSAIAEALGRGGAVLWAAPAGERHGLPSDRVLVLEDGELCER